MNPISKAAQEAARRFYTNQNQPLVAPSEKTADMSVEQACQLAIDLHEEERRDVKRQAYSKQPEEMTKEELAAIILTPDGKGVEFKRACLDSYVNKVWTDLAIGEVHEEVRDWHPDPAGCGCRHCLNEREKDIPVPHKTVNTRMIVCPTCGNKRCPHANDHHYTCTNSNEPGQLGSAYEHA